MKFVFAEISVTYNACANVEMDVLYLVWWI